MYDVIVIGARCAGSPLAMLLARRGHKVLVVDRASFPSDTVSTHYIQQTGLVLLRDWGLLDRVVETNCPPIQHMVLSFTDIFISGFADPVEGITEAYAPRRTVLDKVLVDAAREAGAEVRESFTVREVITDGGRVVGVRGQHGGGRVEELRAKLVVGADGRHSKFGDLVGAEYYRVVPAACFVYYSYYSGLDWPFNHRTGFGEQQMAGWPTNDGLHLVATMRKRHRFAEFRADVETNFHGICDEAVPELGADLRHNGVREDRFYPMLYPDNYYRRSHGPGWALVGDAGYHKDPFTGQGISDAFKHANLLSDRAHQGLSGERDMAEALADYERVRDEETAGPFDLTCAISELTLPPALDTVFRAASLSPEYTRKFFGLIAGSVHGDEFFDPDSLEKLYESVGMPTGQQQMAVPTS